MDSLVEQLWESPRLPDIVQELQARLSDEHTRREKFYEEMVEGQKAEFINGQVVMHSPAKLQHLRAKDHLHRLLQAYVDVRELGLVIGEKALCAFPRNDYEPDVCFFGHEKAASLKPRQIKFPPPDFIAEILSESTEDMDRGEKFEDYEAHGVGEYWIIDPDREVLEQYLAENGKYHLAQKSGSGEAASVVVGGFVIPVRSLFDPRLNLTVLRQLVAPPSGSTP
jgi:Uma2 family endonuclease